jgi:hypothetical protein
VRGAVADGSPQTLAGARSGSSAFAAATFTQRATAAARRRGRRTARFTQG